MAVYIPLVALMIAGIILMIKSADIFVDSAVKIAEMSGIPKMIIGATVVSLATTLPELFVSSTAILDGQNELAIGNALGSILFNTALILSIASIFMNGRVEREKIIEKSIILIPGLVVFTLFSWDLVVNTTEGIILLCFVVVYTYSNIKSVKKHRSQTLDVKQNHNKRDYLKHFIIIVISAIGIRYGAQFLIDGAKQVAELSGASKQVIALTVVAMGTSLPELATTLAAIVKKEQSLSVGNILGANILNITLVLGLGGILAHGPGLVIDKRPLLGFVGNVPQTMFVDLPFVYLIILLFIVPVMIKGRLYKWQGFVGLSLYALYITYLFMNI
jgi:cation:H+ antiporter